MSRPLTRAEQALGMELPSRRLEDWRWTDLSRLITTAYEANSPLLSPAEVQSLRHKLPASLSSLPHLTFINGKLKPDASTFTATTTLSSGLQADEPVLALNFKQPRDGAQVTISKADGPQSLCLFFLSHSPTPQQFATHNIIKLEEGAELTLIEWHEGQGDYLSSSVTEVILAKGAKLTRVKFQLEDNAATHLAHAHVTVNAGAMLNDLTLTRGAKLSRQNETVLLQGEGAEVKVSGAYLLRQSQHGDTRLLVDHQQPSCISRELFKCVMADQARGIFQGKVMVQRHAQKTDGKQSSHALLLSDQAEFDAKPELEIYADDVVCGHGATSGDLDPNHLFYLESRGIPPQQARALLIAAFVSEAFEQIEDEVIGQELNRLAQEWLLNAQGESHG